MNTLHKILEPNTATQAVPDIPALVEVPHSMTASHGIRCAAHALNLSASLAAMHALHVAAIAAGSCKTVQRALCDSYITIERAMRTEFGLAQYHGGPCCTHGMGLRLLRCRNDKKTKRQASQARYANVPGADD